MNMKRFYSRCLLGFAHRRSDNLHIAKRFLCSGWETVNADLIQKTKKAYNLSKNVLNNRPN